MPEHGTSRGELEGLPVKVWGMGSDGKPFTTSALASELSSQGARLDGVTSIQSTGEIIAVQYATQKARFRVVGVAAADSPQAGQIGIKALEPEKCIWQQELPTAKQDTRFRGLGSSSGPPRQERRQHKRYRCAGHVGFRIPGAERHVWGKLSDVSLGGCYVEVVTPAAKATKLELSMQISGVEMALTGEVRTSVPSLGMGVEFTGFPGDVRERLEHLLQKLRPPQLGTEWNCKVGPYGSERRFDFG